MRPRLVAATALLALLLSACAKEKGEDAPGGTVEDQLYIEPRDRSLTSVTDKYGPLVVRPGEFESDTGAKLWSSWWLPLNNDFMFEGSGGQPGPLQKYDEFAKKRGHIKFAAKFERETLYDPHAADWAGHCHAWSLATLLEPEPRVGGDGYKEIEGIKFSLGDLKALLIKTYDYVPVEVFGQRNNGRRTDNYDDIFPEQFHRFLQVEVMEKKRPFMMDIDPGFAVWNYPFYKVNGKIEADPEDKHVFHVQVWVYGAEILDPRDYDKNGMSRKVLDFTYDLIGHPQPDGSLQVVTGEWTEYSLEAHPDFVIPLPHQVERKSRNTEIDPALVDQIVR